MSSKIEGVSATDSRKPNAAELTEWNEPICETTENEIDVNDPVVGKQIEKVVNESVKPVKSRGGVRSEESVKPMKESHDLGPVQPTYAPGDPRDPHQADPTKQTEQHDSGPART
jgi:hypothetical protein